MAKKKTAVKTPLKIGNETMVGDLMRLVIDQLEKLEAPWKDTKETTQKSILKTAEIEIENAVKKAIGILVAEDRPSVKATVGKVIFGSTVAINLVASTEDENILRLAKHKAGAVSLILMAPEVHGSDMTTAPQADKQQKELDVTSGDGPDALLEDAKQFVIEAQRCSISAVQRKLKIGYNRSARLVEALEKAKVVSEMQGNGTRKVLAAKKEDKKTKAKK